MNVKKERTYSRYTRDAAILLGKHIQLARKKRKMTERDFADRVGISRLTLQKIEKGSLKCELGFVFEAAAVAGVTLFNVTSNHTHSLGNFLENVNDKLALLPKSIRRQRQEVDDAF